MLHSVGGSGVHRSRVFKQRPPSCHEELEGISLQLLPILYTKKPATSRELDYRDEVACQKSQDEAVFD